ncbi:HIRAN domain-containing protein [Fenollaria sporofastidiosus]|uniref:HIRAN domain-containing protein n=1 Tax=Fenollaria sporofastidiosus TaxID=2811778 RepID=UPI001BFFDAB2|nr:HIRAN domain-containing protein [Fenollaria sporofastidiosus]
MSDLVKKDDGGGLLGVLHGTSGLVVPKPFEREIYLFTTHVAGTTHVDNILKIDKHLDIDDKLLFFREENPHDEKAIRIETLRKEKIGYVPRVDNVVFSRLMDAGKELYARIKGKEFIDEWLRIEIDIYLKD